VNALTVLAAISASLAALPAWMILNNLRHFKRPRPSPIQSREPISVIIPARNEARNIRQVIKSVQANREATWEIVVVNDQSEDETAQIVLHLATRDERIRLESAPPLPEGWCGKQHACQVGADYARFNLLAFLDADVRLQPDGLVALSDHLAESDLGLASGFPRQITVTWLEKMLIPSIHFILLGFLPMGWMRRTTHPAFAAGCGQFFLVRRDAYRASGGHAAIRASLMDGIMLPRVFRLAGFKTSVVDATHLASCRMYHGAAEVWRGFAKNATEGMAAPARIGPFTLMLLGGQVLPFLLLLCWPWLSQAAIAFALLGVTMTCFARMVCTIRFGHSIAGAFMHPLGIAMLLAIQWLAFFRKLLGRSSKWRGRSYG